MSSHTCKCTLALWATESWCGSTTRSQMCDDANGSQAREICERNQQKATKFGANQGLHWSRQAESDADGQAVSATPLLHEVGPGECCCFSSETTTELVLSWLASHYSSVVVLSLCPVATGRLWYRRSTSSDSLNPGSLPRPCEVPPSPTQHFWDELTQLTVPPPSPRCKHLAADGIPRCTPTTCLVLAATAVPHSLFGRRI